MSSGKYSNKTLPDDPSMFPRPATWLSWVREFPQQRVKKDANGNYVRTFDAEGNTLGYEYEPVGPIPAEGKVRHHYTRAEARKALMWLGRNSKYRPEDERGRFYNDWAVYEWVDDEWVLRGSGVKGEKRSDNPFFKQKLTAEEKLHPFDKAAQDKAIESILKVVS